MTPCGRRAARRGAARDRRSPRGTSRRGLLAVRRRVGARAHRGRRAIGLALLAVRGAARRRRATSAARPPPRRSALGGAGARAGSLREAARSAPRARSGAPARRARPPRAARRARARRAITADARARIARPASSTARSQARMCRTVPDHGDARRPGARPGRARNRYECIAYERRFALPELEGKARTGVIGEPVLARSPTTGRRALTFCKIAPRAGEGGKALADGAASTRPAGDPLGLEPGRRA